MEDFYIVKAEKDSFSASLDILNGATKKLLNKGVMQWEYPWNEEKVMSFIEKGEFYTAFCKGRPCACFGIKDFSENSFEPQDKNGLYWYHFAVHPDFDKTGVGFYVCRWVKQYSDKTGRNIYFDCWAGNKKLVNYYTFMGFEPLGEFAEEDYFVSAFRRTSRKK